MMMKDNYMDWLTLPRIGYIGAESLRFDLHNRICTKLYIYKDYVGIWEGIFVYTYF